ncbi:twin-arginine translocase TatA/TatE family subunit [Salinispirillum sp. LH 10-3-1]|uniref:Sec-independent protein translocase protein TatA n=1 Tax=Salinispirillum sp. LH 10-3-1 TaxID=2952525 RepID=A0AB38YEY8_9GAMM
MLGGISPVQLIIVLVIVVLIFGTKKLTGMGKDIGGAVKGFKQAMNEDEKAEEKKKEEDKALEGSKADAQFSEAEKTSKDKEKQDS